LLCKWIYNSYVSIFLAVTKIFAVQLRCTNIFSGRNDCTIPVGSLVANAGLYTCFHEIRINRNAWKYFKLFNPLQCLLWCKSNLQLSCNSDIELLKNLSGKCKILSVNKLQGPITLGLVNLIASRSVDQNISINKRINAHTSHLVSKTLDLFEHQFERSIPLFSAEPFVLCFHDSQSQ